MRHIYSSSLAIGRIASQVIEQIGQRVRVLAAIAVLSFALSGCGGADEPVSQSIPLGNVEARPAVELPTQISEASPPRTIQKLRSRLERYRPQVSIVSPAPASIIEDDTVAVELEVGGLPLFRDDRFELGPHVRLLLDDREEQLVFDASEPIVLSDLTPGTHTLRAFAERPWSESFKNAGAFAQTTFYIYTKTDKNAPDVSQPLLTYNEPSGTYGAEPILLDFYLTNAPLHAVAREFDDDEIRDWNVRVTVNGQSFSVDRWEPIYLKGVKPGQNWLKLELVDENDVPIENAFNSTVRLFEYDPDLNDGLADIVRGSVSWEEALSIVGVEPPEVNEPAVDEPEVEEEVETVDEIEEADTATEIEDVEETAEVEEEVLEPDAIEAIEAAEPEADKPSLESEADTEDSEDKLEASEESIDVVDEATELELEDEGADSELAEDVGEDDEAETAIEEAAIEEIEEADAELPIEEDSEAVMEVAEDESDEDAAIEPETADAENAEEMPSDAIEPETLAPDIEPAIETDSGLETSLEEVSTIDVDGEMASEDTDDLEDLAPSDDETPEIEAGSDADESEDE